MAIQTHKTFRLEIWGGHIPVGVAWEHIASCGCKVVEGWRGDANEPVIGSWSCGKPEHAEDLEAFQRNFIDYMPEPDRPLHDVLIERFGLVTEGWET